jgi:hypothetical protein
MTDSRPTPDRTGEDFPVSRTPFRRRRSSAWLPVVALSIGLAPGLAEAGALTAEYDIWLAGLPIGTASVDARIDAEQYRVDLKARLTGLAGALTGGQGGAVAAGMLSGQRPVPSSFSAIASSSELTRTLRMALSSGNIRAIEINPPLEDWIRPDRIPVAEAHKRGVIDPLSALVVPAVARDGEASVCSRSLPIFDGATRFNILLSYAGSKTVAKEGAYTGRVAVCGIRYVPIAGHRPMRSVTRFMQDNRDMEVWMAPVSGTNVYMPYRISVRTLVGTTVVEASRFKMESAGEGIPAERAAKAGN